MTTIGKSMFPLKSSYQYLSAMKVRYDKLQGQLATGQRAANLAEMGSDRFFNLSMRSRLGKIESYGNTMTTVNLRLDIADKVISRLDAIEADQRTATMPGGYGSSDINLGTAPTLSRARLDEVLDLLNSNIGGRYLFSGGLSDKKAVQNSAAVIDGAAGRAGFAQVAGERKLADAGADNLGRLEITTNANLVELAEDGTHPFGLKLSTVFSSSADISLTQPAGVPPQLGIQFGGTLPVAGSTVTIGFTLPDGTEEAIVLKAVTGTPGKGEFQVDGSGSAATAANFASALQASVEGLVSTKLAAASVYAAAENFFNGQGQQVMRVDGPPFETATALVAATPTDTVLWYGGEDSADARNTVTARVDDDTSVRYGVQANEDGIVQLVRTLAAMSIETFPASDETSHERFDAMAKRQVDRLAESQNNKPGSIEMIGVELSLAKTTMGNVQARQDAHKGQLETMLADLESISPDEVAMEILALQTRLEASYATTATVANLSLVHHLP